MHKVYPIERLLSAGTYLSAGFVGFIWLIIAALLKKQVRPFLMYHIMQSIFLSIAFFLISQLAGLVYVILYKIPLINAIPYLLNMPLFFGLSVIQVFTTTIILYLTITSAMGLYSYLPWISDIIKGNTR
ncbi:MAG: hypothetical protein NC408_08425 [Candidatus Gastranaerophilales bacterium]|nr:hypothetical protein [Candidatus Gastranaerophilales bacterium]MCM1073904.1 hypothetical protein [Bacteroides sp.]